MSYLNVLKHPKWFEKREEVFKTLGKQCEVCGIEKKLHVHHKSYKIDEDTNHYFPPWEYPIDNFAVLCEECHKQAHKYFKPAVYRVKRNSKSNVIKQMKEKFTKYFTPESKDLNSVGTAKESKTFDTGKNPIRANLASNIGDLFGVEDTKNMHDYGYNFSESHEGSEHIYWMCLSKVHSNAVNRSYNQNNSLQDQLIEEKNRINIDKEKIEGELNEKKSLLKKTNDQVKQINKSILESDANRNAPREDKFYVNLFGGLIILLCVFMFIFYSSAMFNAFFVNVTEFLVEERSFGTIINLDAIPYLWELGLIRFLMGFTAIITAFAIPVGFAVAIHRILFEDKKYPLGISIIFLTLCFDALLAFLIEKNKYQGEYLRGLVESEFTIGVALVEPQFYLILFVGFGTFLMLSGLIHFHAQEKEKLDPVKQEKIYQEKVVKVKREEIENLNNEKTSIEQEIISLETSRNLMLEELKQIDEKINKAKIDLNSVQNYILEFTIGYAAFISKNFTKTISKEKTTKLYEMVNEFFSTHNLPEIKTNVLISQ